MNTATILEPVVTRDLSRSDQPAKALVIGRMGLVRGLGRQGIHVALARENPAEVERYSRYCREFIRLPSMLHDRERAVETLCAFGRRQSRKPVVFLSGESDVLLFSHFRDTLSNYFEIVLADRALLDALVDKGKFAVLAERFDLPVPRTKVVNRADEAFAAADQFGFPCILKPIRQSDWYRREIRNALGLRKAVLIQSQVSLRALYRAMPDPGQVMIQQYIAGPDTQHFDFHGYSDRTGTVRGSIVGHKLRTWPIHFGQGTYTHYVDEPVITELCCDVLSRIGYIGASNINLKRDALTGRDYILEINPRFSFWAIFDQACGVDLMRMQYNEAVGLPVDITIPLKSPRSWLWFEGDWKAFHAYREAGELNWRQYLQSFRLVKETIVFHTWSWKDPLPSAVLLARHVGVLPKRIASACYRWIRRRLHLDSILVVRPGRPT